MVRQSLFSFYPLLNVKNDHSFNGIMNSESTIDDEKWWRQPKPHLMQQLFFQTVIKELNRLGMIIDLSHSSHKTALDAIQASEAPVIFSHSSAFALCNSTRNVHDDVLKLLVSNKRGSCIHFSVCSRRLFSAAKK